jgi:hypothetical protein
MVTPDRIRLTGLLRREPRRRGSLYSSARRGWLAAERPRERERTAVIGALRQALRGRCLLGALTELAPRPTLADVAPGVTVLGETGSRRAGIAIVAIAVAVTAVLGLAIGLFFPATDESGR